ncbi:EAL domain-containing protein (putative c-di-GMP-specific phosphodiesterase class I) [Bacillus pakistanensis]|uniref:EAL domain-containing protein (Putative c-di-GMP-specific phosphodiesterase class I) n=1 Tax=Rossellomorea pakistanensis TaxID=992288 RepID=A0ABS2NFN0_9BACI|nr:EAL domain-containing protein [Bacillus pakistanensis]MBM7586638.1 EAL domain-containing protein (putative c-di-GMP-specific phosphodiesterase class I) [Bacillus pakistanensis]
MDPLDILSNLHCVTPHFQPIFSADEHRIIGYEILGRFQNQSECLSLGPFFQDEEIPDEYRLEVDNIVLQKAIEHMISKGQQDKVLFINRDAKILTESNGEELIELFKSYVDKGLQLNKIVIEISESHFTNELERLVHLLLYYKTFGIKIAIDNMGEKIGQWNQFSTFSPDIFKVDLKHLKKEVGNQAYNDILFSLSILARKLGASLLFENIELDYQLHFAWKNGGRFYQGYYLHKPSPSLQDPNILKEKLKSKCQSFIQIEKKNLQSVYQFAERIQQELQEMVPKLKKQNEDLNAFLRQLGNRLSYMCFRLYICDENGFQKSHNLFKQNGEWIDQPKYLGKNWSWRSYFLENIIEMQNEQRGILSDSYSDIETGGTIRTFSFPLGNQDYLFIDISHDYLYEQDGFLL